jgi:hypothetical protein
VLLVGAGGKCVLPEGMRIGLMAKRKGKNLSAPAKDTKYEGRNNTKRLAKKKG